MKIYYIKNGKCVDICRLITSTTMCCALPFMFTGETLIDAYTRMYHGNLVGVGFKVIEQYMLFSTDSILLPLYKMGMDVTIASDAMNLLLLK